MILEGDTTTPSNVVISGGGSTYCVLMNTRYTMRGFKLQNSASGGIIASTGSILSISALDFGACTGAHFRVISGASVLLVGSYSITGAATNHFSTAKGGIVSTAGIALTVTITGTPAFSSGFCSCGTCSSASLINGQISFSGSATGTRYIAFLNGVIDTNGGGATFLPGDGAGSLLTGGQYA